MSTPLFSAKWNNKKTLFCNARELHKDLNCKTRFPNWILKKIQDCQLQVDREYFLITHEKLHYLHARARQFRVVKFEPNATPALWLRSENVREIVRASVNTTLAYKTKKDYILSLGAAIQIAVLQRNEDGQRVLNYLKSYMQHP